MEKKKRIRLRSSSKVALSNAEGINIKDTSNPTIEEHKKRFPNQSNIFDEIPDVKIKDSQTQSKGLKAKQYGENRS